MRVMLQLNETFLSVIIENQRNTKISQNLTDNGEALSVFVVK